MTLKKCPSRIELLQAADRIALGDGAQLPPELQHHVSRCSACSIDLKANVELFTVLADLHLEAPSEQTLRRALAVPSQSPSLVGPVQSFIAKLLTPPEQAMPAFRGGESDGPPLQIFEAGPYEIDISHLATGALVGQVRLEREEDRTPEVEALLTSTDCILHGAGESKACIVGRGGRFRFPLVKPGRYALLLESEHVHVVLPDLRLST